MKNIEAEMEDEFDGEAEHSERDVGVYPLLRLVDLLDPDEIMAELVAAPATAGHVDDREIPY